MHNQFPQNTQGAKSKFKPTTYIPDIESDSVIGHRAAHPSLSNNTIEEKLYSAVMNDNIIYIQNNLSQYPQHINHPINEKCGTMLHVAVMYRHQEVVELLLQYPELNINQLDNTGTPAIMYCARTTGHLIPKKSVLNSMLISNPEQKIHVYQTCKRAILLNDLETTIESLPYLKKSEKKDALKLATQVMFFDQDARNITIFFITAYLWPETTSDEKSSCFNLPIKIQQDMNDFFLTEQGKSLLNYDDQTFNLTCEFAKMFKCQTSLSSVSIDSQSIALT